MEGDRRWRLVLVYDQHARASIQIGMRSSLTHLRADRNLPRTALPRKDVPEDALTSSAREAHGYECVFDIDKDCQNLQI